MNDRDIKHGIGPNVSRPGSSYHNAGLAFDLAGLSISEMGTVEQIANKYGFYRTVLPKEPWHYSYTNGLQTKDEVAASLGYKNWTTMVDIVQKAYKSIGYPTYKCPYGNDCGL
ncbi:MAG: hypothetical protein GX075_11655 [Firmicutes bacterium]|nr:hypothetical protein [Bacillota bacterium]